MNLRKFPLDSQSCPLLIGSFGHAAGDIIYRVKQRVLAIRGKITVELVSSCQSEKAFTSVNYDSVVLNVSNLLGKTSVNVYKIGHNFTGLDLT